MACVVTKILQINGSSYKQATKMLINLLESGQLEYFENILETN